MIRWKFLLGIIRVEGEEGKRFYDEMIESKHTFDRI